MGPALMRGPLVNILCARPDVYVGCCAPSLSFYSHSFHVRGDFTMSGSIFVYKSGDNKYSDIAVGVTTH